MKCYYVNFLSFGTLNRFPFIVSHYDASRTHLRDTPHSVGLLSTNDQPDAGTLPDNT